MGLVLLLESRDDAGSYREGKTHQNRGQVHPQRGELLVLATRKGLLFATEIGCREIFLKGDAQGIFKDINDNIEDLSH